MKPSPKIKYSAKVCEKHFLKLFSGEKVAIGASGGKDSTFNFFY
jgi:tRNA(Ile)-lysidine synthase TilS/MesJ